MFKSNLFAANHFAPNHFAHAAGVIIVAAQKLIGYVMNVGQLMNR